MRKPESKASTVWEEVGFSEKSLQKLEDRFGIERGEGPRGRMLYMIEIVLQADSSMSSGFAVKKIHGRTVMVMR